MRKFLLITMMCVLGLFGAVNAQAPENLYIVEVGADKNPNSTNNFYVPVYDFSKYGMSQQIYTAEELGGTVGEIWSVAFKLGNARATSVTRQYEVYLTSTERSAFDGNNFVALNETDKVFDGAVEISGVMDTWYTINFDQAFNYTGGNLVLAVYDKTGESNTQNFHYFYKFDVIGRALSMNGTDAYDMLNLTTGEERAFVSQIRFGLAVDPVVKVSAETVALGNVKVGEYWTEEAESVNVELEALSTSITSISCDNAFFTLNYDHTANPVILNVSYDMTAEVGEKTATITVKANNVEDVTIPVTATAYVPTTADVYELAQEITFTDDAFADTPEFTNLNDDYNLPNEVNAGNTPDAVYAFELEEEHTVIVNVDGTNAVAAIYAEDFAGEDGPKADNNHHGIIAGPITPTTFFFDFNDASLEAFNLIDKDEAKANYFNDSYNWIIKSGEGSDGSNVLVSYSYLSSPKIDNANNYIVTKEVYNISQASQLVFDAKCQSSYDPDYVKVEVSTDGENFEYLTTVTPGMGSWEKVTVDLGTLLTEKGLEYGDYYIALHHDEHYHMFIMIDNFQLTDGSVMTRGENAEPQIKVAYPAGKYYLVAAAEDQFSISVTLDIAPPAAPDTLFATAINETSIALKWAKVNEEIDGYNIYRGKELIATVATDTTYVVEGLEANTEYCFAVSAVNKGIESFKTAPACAKTNDYVIAAPANVAVTAVDAFTVKLTWDAVEHAQSYNIYVGEETISTTETAYVFEDLMPNTEYCYEVTAVRNEQETAKVKACGKTSAIDFNDETLATEFFFDFNNQSMEDFMLLDADNDGANWTIAKDNNSANENEYILKSYSDGVAATDNYIYTKRPYRITKSSVVSLDARSGTGGMDVYKGEHYAVVVSENGTDWTVVFEETIDTTVWVSPEVSLAEYAGKGVLVGIRHYNSKVYFLSVDNFRLSQVVVPEAPAAPVVTATAASSSTITLTWAAVEGATSYKVYQGEEVLATVTETTYTVTGLEAEKEYCFNVTAINEVGESAKSENACTTTLEEGNDPIAPEPEVPSAPKVKAEATSDTTIVLTWNPVMTATSFNVYSDTIVIATVTETTYTVTGLTANTEYCFTVTAINENGESAKSENACATTQPDAIAENAASFNIYPNPVNDKLYIETETEIEEVVVYDIFGRHQVTETPSHQGNVTVDVADMKSGVYFVKVVTANGEAVQRFIKK